MTADLPQDFDIFTSLRYDPILLHSEQNSSPKLSFKSPSPYYMLVHHRDRMLEAARYFEFHAAAELLADGHAFEELLTAEVKRHEQRTRTEAGPLKVRIVVNRAGRFTVEPAPVPSVPLSTLYPTSLTPPPASTPSKPFQPSSRTGGALILGPEYAPPPPWAVALDTERTQPSPYTALKTTHRSFYDAARARSLPAALEPGGMAEVVLVSPAGEVMEGSVTSVYFLRDGTWVTPKVRHEDAVESSGGQRGTTRRWALREGLCVEGVVTEESVKLGEGVWVSNGVRGFAYGKIVAGRTKD